MSLIFGLIYTLLFFGYVTTGAFIVFHILRYSLDRTTAIVSATFFIMVFLVLLFTNAIIFFSLPWRELLPASF